MSYLPPEGFAPQALASATRSLAGTGTTNAISVTEVGQVLFVSIETTTIVTGTPTCVLEFVVDGAALASLPLFTAALTYDTALNTFPGTGTGTAAGNFRAFYIQIPYRRSLRIGANCTVAGTGDVKVTVWRAVKV